MRLVRLQLLRWGIGPKRACLGCLSGLLVLWLLLFIYTHSGPPLTPDAVSTPAPAICPAYSGLNALTLDCACFVDDIALLRSFARRVGSPASGKPCGILAYYLHVMAAWLILYDSQLQLSLANQRSTELQLQSKLSTITQEFTALQGRASRMAHTLVLNAVATTGC